MYKILIGESKYDLGTKIQIAGMILQGNGKTFRLYFPEAEARQAAIDQYLSHDEWKELLYQMDVVEVEILDPTKPKQKVVVRKTQREIEASTNWNVFKRDGYKCRYCGNDGVMTVDHIVCWENMGASVEDNLITACRKCNKTRGNMSFTDWLDSDYFKKVWKGNHEGLQDLVIAWGVAQKVPLRTSKRSR